MGCIAKYGGLSANMYPNTKSEQISIECSWPPWQSSVGPMAKTLRKAAVGDDIVVFKLNGALVNDTTLK